MSKTVIDGKEIIYSGSAIVDYDNSIEITLTYDNDEAVYKFKFVPEKPPGRIGRMISEKGLSLCVRERKML
jgi:hypothetical protein